RARPERQDEEVRLAPRDERRGLALVPAVVALALRVPAAMLGDVGGEEDDAGLEARRAQAGVEPRPPEPDGADALSPPGGRRARLRERLGRRGPPRGRQLHREREERGRRDGERERQRRAGEEERD